MDRKLVFLLENRKFMPYAFTWHAKCRVINNSRVDSRFKFRNFETNKISATLDGKMATVIEDIQSLKRLFQICSFCLVMRDKNDISERINSNILDILLDEQWITPQRL